MFKFDILNYMVMQKGKINVNTENIFPIIKKFLYSDNDIFLRELVSNSMDAISKLKMLSSIGDFDGDLSSPLVEIKIDKDKSILSVKDNGIGMTKEEVEKYINQLAFSSAKEFLDTYKDKLDKKDIIGNFGLGFYSSFMVSDKVEIITQSYKDSPAIRWSCDGSPDYSIEEIDKRQRGTEVILHLSEDSKEFLEDIRISNILSKYCKYLPIPIKFGTKKEKVGKDEKDQKEITVDNIINNTNPIWIKSPSDIKNDEYDSFYRDLYPMDFNKPLFNIHINIDHPFRLTGVLYFPKVQKDFNIKRERIQLYQNQVFVTDNLEGIVPDFLMLLKGVIDSPEIPLNVSRSYLQGDAIVKKISTHISKKVADKLAAFYKSNKEDYESKWEDFRVIVEFGMVSDDKFYKKSDNFYLLESVDKKYYTIGEYIDKIKDNQKDKDGKIIILYTSDKDNQANFIKLAKSKSYDVLNMNSPVVSHLMQKIEYDKKDIKFARVDSDHIDKLIDKDKKIESDIKEDEKNNLKKLIEENIPKEKFTVKLEAMESSSIPMVITIPELTRRMGEMSAMSGTFGASNMEFYDLNVNINNKLILNLINNKDEKAKKNVIKQVFNLALLSQGLLKGEELSNFIDHIYSLINAK